MDSGLSFTLKGIAGVIFGVIALLLPEFTMQSFFTLFGVFIAAMAGISLFFAVSSPERDSQFWFIFSVILLLIGIFSIFASRFVAITFTIIIAAWAFISGVSDMRLAFENRRTKYYLIIGIFGSAAVLFSLLLIFFRQMIHNYIMLALGAYALIFGVFCLILGWHLNRKMYTSVRLPAR